MENPAFFYQKEINEQCKWDVPKTGGLTNGNRFSRKFVQQLVTTVMQLVDLTQTT